jgi:hypothetical protein
MKTIFIFLAPLLFIFIIACHSKSKDASNEDTQFYPAKNFIIAEINKLDTIPLAVLRKTVVNNKTDSAYISKEEFRKAAGVFLEPDISDPKLKKLYKETVFMDNTVNAITLTYSPGENEAEVRKMDVLLDPGNNKLERIYMEKEKKNGDSLITHKLMWNAGHSCQVITLIKVGNQPESVLNEKYIWDERE